MCSVQDQQRCHTMRISPTKKALRKNHCTTDVTEDSFLLQRYLPHSDFVATAVQVVEIQCVVARWKTSDHNVGIAGGHLRRHVADESPATKTDV